MKSVTPYLHFRGNCREAMNFYHQCLGGDLQIINHPDEKGQPSADPNAEVMHSQLSRGATPFLMSSDGASPKSGASESFSTSIDCESVDEAQRLFSALSQKGQIRLPLGMMPWGAHLGMLTDQFGIQWMLSAS